MTAPIPSDLPATRTETLRRAADGRRDALASVSAALREGVGALPLDQLTDTDLTRLMLNLNPTAARALLADMPDGRALAALMSVDPHARERLLGAGAIPRFATLVGGVDDATAADLLTGLSPKTLDALLAGDARASRLRRTADYPPHTVGAIMRRRNLTAVESHWTIGEAIDALRDQIGDGVTPSTVFVIDDSDRLVGHLSWRALAVSSRQQRVAEVAAGDVVSVLDTTDQEDAVRLADQHQRAELPVTDVNGRLSGFVSAGDLRAIARDEASEDIMALSTAAVDADPSDSPWRIVRTRFPWLVAAMFGALIAGSIIGSFEDALEQAVILAAFIPLVMDMAGNAGIQSSSVTIEALANPRFWRGDTRQRLLREFLGAALNGCTVGLIAAVVIMVLAQFAEVEATFWLGLTAALTLFVVIVQAALVGVVVPLILKRMRMDPAAGTGVFITTINDFAGITVLFLFATAFYLPHV